MRNYYLTLLLICICGLCFAQQQTNDISTKNPPNKEWNFNNLDGWKYGHPENGEQLCGADAGAAFQRRRPVLVLSQSRSTGTNRLKT